jgi:hypothetical protein
VNIYIYLSKYLKLLKWCITFSWNCYKRGRKHNHGILYLLTDFAHKPSSCTSFQTSSLPLSRKYKNSLHRKSKAKRKEKSKEKLNQSLKMFLCFYFRSDSFLLSSSIYPIISKELSFRLRIHPKYKSNPLSEKEHFSLFSHFHFGKFFLLFCVYLWFSLHQALMAFGQNPK